MVLVASLEISSAYAILASTTLVLAASYSLWLGKRILFGEISSDTVKNMKVLQKDEFWSLFILTLMIIFFGIQPNYILEVSHASSLNMINLIMSR